MKIIIIIVFAILFNPVASAVVLENLTNKQLHNLLKNKKVGFYVGSFDPIHKGHKSVVTSLLQKKLVDYVIIYPVWGGDKYKNRIDVNIRLKMLFSLYKDHPKVLVTKLPPLKLQELLMVDSKYKIGDWVTVKTAINGTEYVGIIGSDVATSTVKNKKKLSVFMRGIKVTEKHKEDTVGCIIAIPVEKFIVFLRNGENIDPLNGMIADRKITAIIISEFQNVSSTKVRNKIKNNENASDMLSAEVIEIVKQEKLYKKTD